MKLKIQQKIQLYILGTVIIVFILAIGYISYVARTNILNNSIELTECQAVKYATKLEKILDADMVITRTLARVIEKYMHLSMEDRKELIAKVFVNILKDNPDIDALWDTWDLEIIDTIVSDSIKRYSYMCWWENGEIKEDLLIFKNYSPAFYIRKKKGMESVVEPYFYLYPGHEDEDSILLTDLSTPFFDDQNNYVFSAAIDFRLTSLQKIVSEIKPFVGSQAFLLSNMGNCIGHPNGEMLGKDIEEIYPTFSEEDNIHERIKVGEVFSFKDKIAKGERYYFTFKPINIGKTYTPWSLGIAIPLSEINKLANETFIVTLWVGIIGLVCLAFVIWIISRSITTPVRVITNSLKGLAKGQIGSGMKLKISTGDEIEVMGEAFNKSIDALNEKAVFAKEIGDGKLDTNIELLGDDDILGNSLIGMRDSLQKVKEEEKIRQAEDDRRRWVNEGLAKFGDLLRKNDDNLENLSYDIINNLVDYLNANQGEIFIINDENLDDKFLELKATYAFDKRRYNKKRVNMGDGLTGTCALEGEKIYLTNIPQDFIAIKSGLGDDTPTNLLIVPIKFENEVLGVIEIASYEEIVDYEIEFTERIADNVASSISSVQINAQTIELLAKSKQQAEELAAQEEEMRQNMEELQATQEEAARKGVAMDGLINALNISSLIVEYDLDKKVIHINDAYLEIHGMKREEVIGLYHYENMEFTEEQKKDYEQFWDDLKRGEVKYQQSTFTMRGEEYHLIETFTPIRDEYGEIYKILKIAYDISEHV